MQEKTMLTHQVASECREILEYYLANVPQQVTEPHLRALITSLFDHLYTHIHDPDGCLIGMRAADEV